MQRGVRPAVRDAAVRRLQAWKQGRIVSTVPEERTSIRIFAKAARTLSRVSGRDRGSRRGRTSLASAGTRRASAYGRCNLPRVHLIAAKAGSGRPQTGFSPPFPLFLFFFWFPAETTALPGAIPITGRSTPLKERMLLHSEEIAAYFRDRIANTPRACITSAPSTSRPITRHRRRGGAGHHRGDQRGNFAFGHPTCGAGGVRFHRHAMYHFSSSASGVDAPGEARQRRHAGLR